MLVTLPSAIMSGFCLIAALYAQNPAFYAEVPSIYAKIPAFYADICLFGFHCSGNMRWRVLIFCLWSIDNDGARVMHRRGGTRWWRFFA